MLTWIFVICIFVLASLVQHLGIFSFSFLVEPWDKIILDILLLLIVLGILGRMTTLKRKGEKEKLKETIKELLSEIKILKGEKEKEEESQNQTIS